MAKKTKQPESAEAATGESNTNSNSSDIFTKLLGAVPQNASSTFLFSADNPFRRKPSHLGMNSAEKSNQNPEPLEQETPSGIEPKKIKIKTEKRKDLDPRFDQIGADDVVVGKKLKTTGSDNEALEQENPSEVGPKRRNRSTKKVKDRDARMEQKDTENVAVSKKSKTIRTGVEVLEQENPSDAKSKKRDRSTEKSKDLDADSEQKTAEDVLVGKKSKKISTEGARKGNDGLPVGLEVGQDDKVKLDEQKGEKRKKKEKRKRDELEKEYEARRFGVVAEEEEEQGQDEGKKKEKLVGKKRKTVENPGEMTISKDGYDDESKLLRTVFVGNLPLKVKKKALLREFGQFGEIESLRIRSVPTLDSKEPKKVKVIHNKLNDAADSVHAYIVFKTEDAVDSSLAHNMSVFEGNHIRVDRACPPRKKLKGDSAPLYDNKRTVFVGNLPFDVKDEELYQLFCGISRLESSIEAIRVIRDPSTSLGKGIAYVLFKTREAANSVVKRKSLKLRDRELRLSHAKSNSTPTKRKYPTPGNTENPAAKRSVEGFRTPSSSSIGNTRAAASYQGLRASKSSAERKSHPKTRQVNRNAGAGSGEVQKQRKFKRPAVEARKAKANGLNIGGGPKGGKKRKMESRTPNSSFQKKRFKK